MRDPEKTEQKSIKETLKASGAKDVEGVYQIKATEQNSTEVKKYIGQSKNILKRTKSHFKIGAKFDIETLDHAVFYEMKGSSKLEREVYEHYLIEKHNAKESAEFLNKVYPMGGRLVKYNEMLEYVFKKYPILPR